MKKLLFILLISIYTVSYSQDVIIYVQAKHENTPVELDTIIIENLNNGSIANLYDLPVEHTNYEINLSQGAEVNSISQSNVSNPCFRVIANEIGFCSFNITSNNPNSLNVELFDIKGQLLYSANSQLNSGVNAFEFQHGYSGLCILKLTTENDVYSIKTVGDGYSATGLINTNAQENDVLISFKSIKSEFTYNLGDTIKITAKKLNYHSNTIVIKPENNENYKIYISCPCSGIPTVTDYDGNIYNTVQIGNQCWMKENMNTTHYADGTEILDGTGVPDGAGQATQFKYYFNYADNPANALICGKLYTWAATINGYVTDNYDLESGVRKGICPDGWHVPSDEEWLELEMYVDDSISLPDFNGERGVDVGIKLKSFMIWQDSILNTNMYGFSIIPCGQKTYSYLNSSYDFSDLNTRSIFWTATANCGGGALRAFILNSTKSSRGCQNPSHGYSVRCIKD
ncbi:MAG TPA: FISUMP domain-containing protein [Bacteroidales bacterium]|nr:FISUMP domain-containing protein [Bacteroidales bacterium]